MCVVLLALATCGLMHVDDVGTPACTKATAAATVKPMMATGNMTGGSTSMTTAAATALHAATARVAHPHVA